MALTALIVFHAICATYAFGSLWDFRVFQSAWYDHAWHLEIAWLARIGEWSGRDFHYPRGPLWQAVAWLGSQPWREPLVASDTIAGISLLFRLAGLGVVIWVAWTRVEARWLRPVALVLLASLAFGAGVPTFRALLSLLVVLVYVPPIDEEDPKPWARAFATAIVTVVALLLSFDRFGIAVLSVGAAALGELLARRRAGQPLRPATLRVLRAGAALAVALGVVSLVGLGLGVDPIEYVVGQRQLASGYASGMRTPWYVGVPPANVAGLFLTGVALIALAAWRGAGRSALSWMAGALPAALFGVITSDQGHIFMAILPFAGVMILLVCRPRFDWLSRATVGLLGGITLLGWFGTYPEAFSLQPHIFADAIAVATGEKRAERNYTSDHSRAVAWARTVVAREHPECIAFWPSLTVAHAMAQVPGPTRLALRWNDQQQRELAERIRAASCPRYLHDVLSFDDIGGAWFLGPDFLTIVELYEYEERVGAGLVSMRRRERPVEIAQVPLEVERDAFETELPGEIRIPFARPVDGTSVIRLDYSLDVPGWRAQFGGLPWAEVRFERDGEPLGEWETLHHLRAGDGTVLLAPDPEAVEWLWIGRRTLERRWQADALRIRFERRGRLTPSSIGFSVRRIVEHPPPDPPPAEPARFCRGELDLMEEIRAGHAFARMTAPRPDVVHFHLDPNERGRPLAEILFPIRPCVDSCFFAGLGVQGEPGQSDGVVFEVHSIWRENRPLLASIPMQPGMREAQIELPIGQWADEPQLLRIGTLPNESHEGDFAVVAGARIGPCTARRWLAEALTRGEARVSEGRIEADGRHLVVGPGVGRIEYPMRVIENTCVGLGWSSDGAPTRARISVGVHLDDLEQVLYEEIIDLGSSPGGTAIGLHDYTDREVGFTIDVRPLDEGASPVRIWGPHIYECES